jgi:hypothetical protein
MEKKEFAEQIRTALAEPQHASARQTPEEWAQSDRAAADGIEMRNIKFSDLAVAAKHDKLAALPPGDSRARLAELNRPEPDMIPANVSRQWATLDAKEFAKIKDQHLREAAAINIAANMTANPDYRQALEKEAPEVATVARKADAELNQAIERKEERKTTDTEVNSDIVRWTAAEIFEVTAKEGALQLTTSPSTSPPEEVFFLYSQAQVKSEQKSWPATDELKNFDFGTAPYWLSGTVDSLAPVFDEQTLREAMPKDWSFNEIYSMSPRAYAETRGLNSLEPNIKKEQQQPKDAETPKPQADKRLGGNQVQSDEIFTAEQRNNRPITPPDVERRYFRVGSKFYDPKTTGVVSFEDKGNKLETNSNSEAIASTVVRIAKARGWDEIKVSGSETFRKEVWIEAAARGMHIKGYTPSEQDKAEVTKRLSQTEANKVAKENQPVSREKLMAESFAKDSFQEAAKKYPELAGAAAAVAAINKKAQADGLTPQQQAIVDMRIRQNVVNSIEHGRVPNVRIQDEIEATRVRNEEKELSR